jgi:hypothetical protein
MAMNYNWKVTLKFKVNSAKLRNPGTSKFSAATSGTLTGNWVGDLTGTRTGGASPGKYHCEYKGTKVASRIRAQLQSAPKGKVRVIFTAVPTETGVRFFPGKGNGATISCANAISNDDVPHFNPAWLFRETFSDAGKMSSNTAVITLPATILPRGSAKVKFPREIGEVDSPLRDKLAWNNVGTLSAVAR